MPRLISLFVLAFWAATQSSAPLVVRDIDGGSTTPLAPATGTANLLFFVNTECPISARYSPEIDRIAADYAKRGVHTWLIYPDSRLTANGARENLKAFHPKLAATIVIDADFTLTKIVDATVTPEAAIYTNRGRAYRGRIDDLYETIGTMRRAPTERTVRAALDAVLAGKPVAKSETTPVGCFIERK